MGEQEVEVIVRSSLAGQQMTEAADYMQRGRCFKDATAEALQAAWVESVRHWSGDPVGRVADQDRNDICAEYLLRGANPPIAPVREHTEKITKTITSGAAEIDEEAWERLNDKS